MVEGKEQIRERWKGKMRKEKTRGRGEGQQTVLSPSRRFWHVRFITDKTIKIELN